MTTAAKKPSLKQRALDMQRKQVEASEWRLEQDLAEISADIHEMKARLTGRYPARSEEEARAFAALMAEVRQVFSDAAKDAGLRR